MKISGNIFLKGDKSLAHRAIMLASISKGESRIKNIPYSEDVMSTVNVIRECGINIKATSNEIRIIGDTFKYPKIDLDCKNSGTTMRLLAGLLSYKKIPCTLVGDKSLSSRPMERIINPLTKMNNQILSANGCAPITLENFSNQSLNEFQMFIPSAQVKSCLILAALGCDSKTKIIEKIKTRDHLELMLSAIDSGIIEYIDQDIIIHPIKDRSLQGFDIKLPGDVSSASYLIAAAVILNNSRLVINDLLLNSQRIGFIRTLMDMGANIKIDREETRFNENIGRLIVKGSARLMPIHINKNKISPMIDEIPILSLVCAYVEGESIISGLEELRYKESDRLKGIYDILEVMGVKVTLHNKDQIRIKGENKLYNTNKLADLNDHRLAMMISIAQIVSGNSINYPDCIDVSFPNFKNLIEEILEV
jgi:3-phosphoshikimate 1-carboxyvinyltransferase